jgi:hypothetical protein
MDFNLASSAKYEPPPRRAFFPPASTIAVLRARPPARVLPQRASPRACALPRAGAALPKLAPKLRNAGAHKPLRPPFLPGSSPMQSSAPATRITPRQCCVSSAVRNSLSRCCQRSVRRAGRGGDHAAAPGARCAPHDRADHDLLSIGAGSVVVVDGFGAVERSKYPSCLSCTFARCTIAVIIRR